MNWKHTSKGEYPQATKKERDEIQCLVCKAGMYGVLSWNNHYQCWDDEQGDDYLCDKEAVDKWEYLSHIVNTLNANESNKKKPETDPRDIFRGSTPYFDLFNSEGD